MCSLKPILTKVLPLTFIYLVTNYLYAQSLINLSNTTVSAVMASEIMFVYLLSLLLLVSTELAGFRIKCNSVVRERGCFYYLLQSSE